MNNKRLVFIALIFIAIIIVLYMNYQDAKNQMNKVFIISYQGMKGSVWDIDAMEIPSRQDFDKEHLSMIEIALGRAISHSKTLSAILGNNNMEFYFLNTNERIGRVNAAKQQDGAISSIDYEQYLEIRKQIKELNSILNNEKFLNVKFSNKKLVEELKTQLNSFYHTNYNKK